MHGFARRVSSPKGFVLRAEGFSPAVAGWRTTLAVGLKPSATATKAAYAACPQNRASHLVAGPELLWNSAMV